MQFVRKHVGADQVNRAGVEEVNDDVSTHLENGQLATK